MSATHHHARPASPGEVLAALSWIGTSPVGIGPFAMVSASTTCDTGNTLAAATGASTKELIARMGHASMRAAPIYEHASVDRRRRHSGGALPPGGGGGGG